MSEENKALERELEKLVAERQEREASLPAHSIRPHQLLVLEELSDRIDEIRASLAHLDT